MRSRFATSLLATAAFGALLATPAGSPAVAAAGGTPVTGSSSCHLGGGISRVVYIQFDNVHFTRDDPNVPSDLEQMPHLLNFLKSQGTLLTDHHTPLISHTSVDILTALSGLYGDRMGIPVGNSFRYFKSDGSTASAASFAYWTAPVASSGDTKPQMIGKDGKIAPAPWVAYTRAGCDVGAFSVANIEFENITRDIDTVFGPTSPQHDEATTDPAKAQADFLGIAVHCAKDSALCASGQADLLPDEPGGYTGFKALFGNKYVQPQISSDYIKDLDGHVIEDAHGNPGFPNLFNPSASQSLGYLAAMLEAGIPVVYGYISDAHDNHITGTGTFGPGEAGYETQLQQFDTAFGQFFDRLAAANITPQNTLFVVTSDENDHFVGGDPSPAGCDGVEVPCSYSQIGEINGDLSRLLATQTGNTTKFTVHSDSAPTIYITGNPGQTDTSTRQLERDVATLTAVNPITLGTDTLTAALAGVTEMKILHMVTADPQRTPTFTMFGNEDYFFFSSGSTTNCSTGTACVIEQPGFAWNHGDFQNDITQTWLGVAGPGVKPLGVQSDVWSDHADIRPTMMALTGLADDYVHDGRALFEVMDGNAGSRTLRAHRATLLRLAQAYKQINAPVGSLSRQTLRTSTDALSGDAATYSHLDAELADLLGKRDTLAARMIGVLDAATFGAAALDEQHAKSLIDEANALLASAGAQ